jgi:CRP/FNR family transcriptional regulator
MHPKMQIEKGYSKLWYISRFNLLGMSKQEMQSVAAMTRMTRHRRGDLIYLPGDPSNSIYFLKEGRMKITGLSEDGREVLLDIIGPGEIFGEASAIQDTPRTTSAAALEDALLCEMERKDFEALLAMHPEMSLRVLQRVGFRLKKVEAQLLSLICKDVRTRVREALVGLVDDGSASSPTTPFKIRLTQQDVANLVGASRQETSRALKELEDSGALELKYRSIIVTAPDRLRSKPVLPAR